MIFERCKAGPLAAACLLMGGLTMMPAKASAQAVLLNGTQEFSLVSEQTGRDYLIQVAVPASARPEGGYPVLYVLDGNARFPLAVAARDTLFHGSPVDEPSRWMIVGIGYPGTERFDVAARAEDYTPPAPDVSATGDVNGHPQGGADRFLDFIEQRLKPEIASRFAVDGSRQALMGHSYGGLFTLYALLARPQAFSRYIAVSPSLWWNERYLFEMMPAMSQEGTEPQVMIGVGGREQSSRAGEEDERARRRRANAMIDNAREAADRLHRHRDGTVTFICFPGEDHGSVVWPAMRRGLEMLHDRDGASEWRRTCD